MIWLMLAQSILVCMEIGIFSKSLGVLGCGALVECIFVKLERDHIMKIFFFFYRDFTREPSQYDICLIYLKVRISSILSLMCAYSLAITLCWLIKFILELLEYDSLAVFSVEYVFFAGFYKKYCKSDHESYLFDI